MHHLSEMPRMPTSYPPEWGKLLLRPVQIPLTSVIEKEALIQSGQKHYSEMLSAETAPSGFHLDLFQRALEQYAEKIALDVISLAYAICQQKRSEIVFASLVRAGIPLGILLKLACTWLGYSAEHYGISIIRDRGLDDQAMTYIEARHAKQNIFFVDGWTGKGAISQELARSLTNRGGYPDLDQLVVLSDLSASAWLSADDQDWLIPFGLLGAPIAGLLSRSIWSETDFHGCYYWDNLSDYDQSVFFIETITGIWDTLDRKNIPMIDQKSKMLRIEQKQQSQKVITSLADAYQIKNLNRIKPGIAEATRAVLRRVPDRILIQDPDDPDVILLLYLADQLNLSVMTSSISLAPYRAITIIQKIGQDA